MMAEDILREEGVNLPPPPTPLGEYAALKQAGALVFLSGMLPLVDGKPAFEGPVSKEEAREAARIATVNAISVLRQHLGCLDRVRQVVRVSVYIASNPEFQEHAYVADGASQLLNRVFPQSDRHARLVFGVASLPIGSPLELEMILEIAES